MNMYSKSGAQRFEHTLQPPLTLGNRHEFDLGTCQVAIGGNQREALHRRGQDKVVCRGVAQ
jgi:hypothetical protein